jgi:hypothetical protein
VFDHVVFFWVLPVVLVLRHRTLTRGSGVDGDRRTVVTIAAAAVLFGAWELEGALLPWWRARGAGAWQVADGTVVSSQVRTTMRGLRSRARSDYFTNVGTEFSAGGVRDTAWRVGLTRNAGPAAAADSVAARYPVGARVRVFYDPARPWEAVLERDAPAVSLPRFVFGAALVAGAFALLAAGGERRSRPSPLSWASQ